MGSTGKYREESPLRFGLAVAPPGLDIALTHPSRQRLVESGNERQALSLRSSEPSSGTSSGADRTDNERFLYAIIGPLDDLCQEKTSEGATFSAKTGQAMIDRMEAA
jgi:hypothetical protein